MWRIAVSVDDVAVVKGSGVLDYFELSKRGASVEYFVVTMMINKLISQYYK